MRERVWRGYSWLGIFVHIRIIGCRPWFAGRFTSLGAPTGQQRSRDSWPARGAWPMGVHRTSHPGPAIRRSVPAITPDPGGKPHVGFWRTCAADCYWTRSPDGCAGRGDAGNCWGVIHSSLALHQLGLEHAAELEALASDPEVAATTRIPHPYPAGGARLYIEEARRQREAGNAYVFAIMEGGHLVGACGLHEIVPGETAEVGYWVGRPHWGRGIATFATGMLLEFAFRNLRLPRVIARTLERNHRSRRVLEKSGFAVIGMERHQHPGWNPDEPLVRHELASEAYFARRYEPFLRDLRPELRQILESELAAGNEIGDCSRGWPEKASVIVALKKPFRKVTEARPAGVEYRVIGDPHWWNAEYSTKHPSHLLTCGF